ncbi:hypothetical protein [Embleya scabrispora]|nr:hypothetical protein [Embleya scabrispora]
MSHHLGGPNPRSPKDDARLDLTDLFVFSRPAAYPSGRTLTTTSPRPG